MQDPDLKLGWFKDLDREEILKHLSNDARLIYEYCGLEVLIALWEKLSSINLYLSDKPLMDLRRVYVRKHYKETAAGNNSKQLAVTLGVSEQFVYVARTEKNGARPDDPTLFPL